MSRLNTGVLAPAMIPALIPAMVLICLALATGSADGQPRSGDRAVAPPIEIEAENSDYDLRSGVSRFWDNVVITRGEMIVHADHGTLHQAEGRISRVELRGTPSTWRDILEDGSELEGEAREIQFDIPANVITMTGNARIRHAQGEYTGHELVYDLSAESLSGTRGDTRDRVRVVIEPEVLPENQSELRGEADQPPPEDAPVTDPDEDHENGADQGTGDDPGPDAS